MVKNLKSECVGSKDNTTISQAYCLSSQDENRAKKQTTRSFLKGNLPAFCTRFRCEIHNTLTTVKTLDKGKGN